MARAVAALSPRASDFDPRSLHVRSEIGKVALGQGFAPSNSVSFQECSILILHFALAKRTHGRSLGTFRKSSSIG